jgi:hypothetical protein
MNTQQLRGLTLAEIADVRASLKLLDLDKLASVRVHPQAYAKNSIDIRPRKGAYDEHQRWSEDNFARMAAFVETLNVVSSLGPTNPDVAYAVHCHGFLYLSKAV